MNNHIRNSIFFVLFCFSSYVGSSQMDFTTIEEELAYHCDIMVNASEPKHRAIAMQKFNAQFMIALEDQAAVSYPFDSLKWISIKSPEDQSFRLFTWEVDLGPEDVRYFGAIKTKDNRLFVFQDNFKNTLGGLKNEEFGADAWIGSLYYHLMEVNSTEGKYYLVFGINRWNAYENIKLVDVLFFTKEGIPYFGKPVFKAIKQGEKEEVSNRLLYKYASDGYMTLNYNPGMELIVVDNLVRRMSRIPGQGETMVSDGSYIGYELKEGLWYKIDKIATQIMDEAPRPKPILDQRKGKKIMGN